MEEFQILYYLLIPHYLNLNSNQLSFDHYCVSFIVIILKVIIH